MCAACPRILCRVSKSLETLAATALWLSSQPYVPKRLGVEGVEVFSLCRLTLSDTL